MDAPRPVFSSVCDSVCLRQATLALIAFDRACGPILVSCALIARQLSARLAVYRHNRTISSVSLPWPLRNVGSVNELPVRQVFALQAEVIADRG